MRQLVPPNLYIFLVTRKNIRIGLILFLLFFSVFAVKAQDIASLEKELKDSKITEIKRVEILNQLSLFLSFVDSRKALDAANEAIAIAQRINDNIGLANAYRNLSILYFYYDENYSISMEYLQRALDIFENNHDSIGIANCYISLGHAYRGLRIRDKEIEYHKKSLEIFKRLKITERIGVSSMNLGESYLNNGEYDKSRSLLKYAIMINDSINKLTTLSSCYKAMGMLEYMQKDYDQAERNFNKVLEISDRLGDNFQKISTIESMIQLASLYKLKGDNRSQVAFLKKAAEFSQKNYLMSYLRIIYTELILYYSKENDQKSVQKYITEYKVVSDSINSRQLTDRSGQIGNIVELHNLEKEKRRLEEYNLVQKESLRRRNLILLVIIVSGSVLVWLLLNIYRKNKKITEVNQLLNSQREIIETQRQHLEELNNTKDKFFSIVAHDLRSPLASLKSFSDLLIDQVDSLTIEEIKMMGTQLQLNVDNTIKMTDNLLTWARIQMKDYEVLKEKFYISELTSDIIDFYKGIANEKGITLSCNVENNLTAFADKNQIAFVLRNLVNNAIKFTKKNGFVVLKAEPIPGAMVQISVSDNGIGISQELKKNIFFLGKKQSANGTAGEKGTGLGLILSYEFIKLNGGSIEVESQEGHGTTFKIRFNSGKEI
jgi:signal transduction histidine kinase